MFDINRSRMRRPGFWCGYCSHVILGLDPRTQKWVAPSATGFALGPPVKPEDDSGDRPEDDRGDRPEDDSGDKPEDDSEESSRMTMRGNGE